MSQDELIEKLAAIEHEQWIFWSKSVHDEVDLFRAARWRKLWIPYNQLTEEQKEQDRVWARKVVEVVSCSSHNSASEPAEEPTGSIRQTILQEDAYLIERVNAGLGEWEYAIQYCGEYYATAPSEEIARDIVKRAQWQLPSKMLADEREKVLDELDRFVRSDRSLNRQIGKRITLAKIESLRQQKVQE